MNKTIKATKWTCDGCGDVEVLMFDADEPPEGWHFTAAVLIHAGGGQTTRKVWACCDDCVLPALKAGLE